MDKGLGRRLREVRELLHLTLEEFYEGPQRIVSRTLGSRYESGEITPKIETLVALSKAHGINLHWLLTGEGPIFIRRNTSKYPPEVLTGALSILGLDKPLPFLSESAHIVAATHYVFAKLVDEAVIDGNPVMLQRLMNSLLQEDTFLEKYSAYSYYHPIEAAVRAVHEIGAEEKVLSFGENFEPPDPIISPIALCVEIPLRDPDANEGPYTALALRKGAEYSFIIESEIPRGRVLEILKNKPELIDSKELKYYRDEVMKKYFDIVLPVIEVLADKAISELSTKSRIFLKDRKIPSLKLKIPQEVWR